MRVSEGEEEASYAGGGFLDRVRAEFGLRSDDVKPAPVPDSPKRERPILSARSTQEVENRPRSYVHKQFGDVTETDDQGAVPRGHKRVVDA